MTKPPVLMHVADGRVNGRFGCQTVRGPDDSGRSMTSEEAPLFNFNNYWDILT
jgi:hypothetical protein